MGRLCDGNVFPLKIDVPPFETEDFADAQPAEETELEACLVPKPGEEVFVEGREDHIDISVGVDVGLLHVFLGVIAVLLEGDARRRVQVDQPFVDEPIAENAKRDQDVVDRLSRVVQLDQLVLEGNDVFALDLSHVALFDVLKREGEFDPIVAQGVVGENGTTARSAGRRGEELADAIVEGDGARDRCDRLPLRQDRR